ncbi:MAG: sel1 repeat family protein [Gammaproteobacteria bacterium]|jgi:TPR repeat protein|nr:sel1 repeat family protein [Gammaproteobacteria bacterium]
MKLPSSIFKSFCLGLSILTVQGCNPDPEPKTGKEVILYDPVFPEAKTTYSTYHCNDFVKSAGAKEAFAECLEQAKQGNVHAQAQLGAIYAKGDLGTLDWEEAMYWFLQAAEQGHPEAQFVVAQSLLIGRGIAKNQAMAINWLNKSAKANYLPAQTTLGLCYLNGEGIAQNNTLAIQWLTMSANQGNPDAEYHLAKIYLDGTAVAKNIYLAQKLFDQAASQGVILAQLELANLYNQGQDFERNEEKAFYWYESAAKQDEPHSLYVVGMSYVNGNLGQQKNAEVGAEYLKRAADKGYYPAQYALATLFLEGYPVLKDKFTAIEYLRLAAMGGSHDAQIKLAKILIEFSIPQYDKVAFYWAEKAAHNQNAEALYLLGTLYADGIGTEVNHEKAFEIFSQLAEQNHSSAQFKLGQLYYYGKGIDKDHSLAKKWFLKSARLGSEDAKNWVAIVYRDALNTNQNDENEEEINNWIQYAAENGEPEAIFLKGMNYLYGRNHMPQNIDQGMNLINEAASKEFVPALRELGMIYEQGLFGMNNTSKAHEWYLKASQKGDGYAQYRLANMYFVGDGIDRDYVQSYAWANLASMSGKDEATVLRDEISQLLSASDLEQARNLSNEYFEAHRKGQNLYAMPMNIGIP